jgi:hypothetical protein
MRIVFPSKSGGRENDRLFGGYRVFLIFAFPGFRGAGEQELREKVV